jgi:hypothetical protein
VKSSGFDDLIVSRNLLTVNQVSVEFCVSEVVKKSIRTSFDVPRSIRFVVYRFTDPVNIWLNNPSTALSSAGNVYGISRPLSSPNLSQFLYLNSNCSRNLPGVYESILNLSAPFPFVVPVCQEFDNIPPLA